MPMQTQKFKYDKRIDGGWKLIESVKIRKNQQVVVFKEYRKRGELYVKGDEMIRRAKQMGSPAGQLHAEKILDRLILMPDELKKLVLIFTGTIWEHPDGHRCAPVLRIGKICDIENLAGFGVPVFEGLHNYGWTIDFVRLDKGLLTPARVAIIEK